ncbi:MAG TPA: GFA family protein [Rhodopila sp.]|nr:GFA family protein [Rhodopila sp.]
MSDLTGRCRCGKVSFTVSADPVFVGVCHCRACQKSTGSAYATVFGIPAASLVVSGVTKRFDDVGDSGNATHREFCPECGSTIAQSADAMAGVTMVPLGTLDDPGALTPAVQIYCDSAMPWAMLGGGMQAFAKMPG